MMRDSRNTVVISGASGWIGSHLVRACREQGYHVLPISRKRHPDYVLWDPSTQSIELPPNIVVDAWINLAGESIAGRWTPLRRQQILNSRITSTQLAVHAVLNMPVPPKRFISVSACGYYGDGGDALITEDAAAGSSFLAQVCRQWEGATLPLRDRGIKVILPRLGTVLGLGGGAWPRLHQAARYYAGCYFGDGQQWWPWVGLEDCIEALLHLVGGNICGPCNLVAPQLLRQREAMKIISSLMDRPCWRCPKWLIQLLLGEMADNLLLTSCKAQTHPLLAQNLKWHAPTFETLCRTLMAQSVKR